MVLININSSDNKIFMIRSFVMYTPAVIIIIMGITTFQILKTSFFNSLLFSLEKVGIK